MSSTQSNTRRSMFFAVAAATTALYAGLLTTPAAAQEAFTLNADSNTGNAPNPRVYQWTTAPWTGGPTPPPQEHPGQDDLNDIATINFREFNNADQTGDAHVDIDLRVESVLGSGTFDTPGTFTLNTLNLTESGTGNTDGDFQNGTLNVSNINYTAGGREIDFESTLTLNGNGGSLAVNTSGANNLDLLGAVNAGTSFSYTGTGQFVRLSRTTTASLGALNLNYTAGSFVVQNFDSTTVGSATSTFTVPSITVQGAGRIELDRSAGANVYNLEVTGTTNINPATGTRLRFDANDDDLLVNLNGLITINNAGAGVEIGIEDQRAVVNINAGIADGGSNDVLTFNLHGANNGLNDYGTLNILTTASSRTAQTNIFGGGRLVLNVDNGLGSGRVNVQTNGALTIATAQTVLNINAGEFGAIGGELSNANYGTNVLLAPQNVIFLQSATLLPTTAQTGGAVHLVGVTTTTGTITVGDDGNAGTTDDIFKGVAFASGYGINSDFGGTVNEAQPGQGIQVYMAGSRRFGGNANATATFNTTAPLTISGPGLLDINEPDVTGTTRGISSDVISRLGVASAQNNTILRFSDASAFHAGQTISVTDGRVDLDNAGAVQIGATVNIDSGATLSLDQNVTGGTYNINAGGAIAATGAANITTAGPTFNFTTGTLFVIDFDGATTAAYPTNVDYVLQDADADDIDGVGIVLGNGRRLATPGTQSVDLTGGTGVSAAAGATNVIFSAAAGDTLDINDPVNLVGVDLLVGDVNPFTTIVSGGTGGTNYARTTDAQTGTVAINATASRSIDVRSGLLRFEPGSIPGLQDGSITTAVGGVGGSTTINSGGAVEVEFNQGTDPTGIQINETFIIPAGYSPENSPGFRTFLIDRVNTATGGTDRIDINNVLVGNNATIGTEVQDAGTNARISLSLMGTATTIEGFAAAGVASNGSNNDWTLKDVRGINPDGTANTTDPRTLNIGFTPAGTALGSAAAPNSGEFVLVQSVAGQIDSNVTVNVINGQIDFLDGAVLNGTVNVATRTGDFFMRIRAGADGTAPFLTGTGVVNHGQASAGTEDIAGYVNEVATGGTALRNFTDVRFEILPTSQSPAGAILRAERGTDSNVNGLFHFTNVHVNNSILQLDSANEQNLMANVVLDGNGILTPANGADDANRVFVGVVTDPGTASDLRVRGTTNLRFVDAVSAKDFIVGGGTGTDATGRVVFQASGTLPTVSATSAVLTLTGAIVLGQGGQIDVNTSITAGLQLSGDGDLDVTAPFDIPSGKRLTGSNSSPIQITAGGSLTVGTGGILAPGASPGVLLIEGDLAMADNSTYEYEIGTDPTSSDRVTITNGTVTFGPNLNLDVSNFAGADPAGQTYVLYSYTGADPTLQNVTFTGPLIGDVMVDATNNQVLLTNVVPEPGSLSLLAAGALGLLARRRRPRA